MLRATEDTHALELAGCSRDQLNQSFLVTLWAGGQSRIIDLLQLSEGMPTVGALVLIKWHFEPFRPRAARSSLARKNKNLQRHAQEPQENVSTFPVLTAQKRLKL